MKTDGDVSVSVGLSNGSQSAWFRGQESTVVDIEESPLGS